MKNRLLFSCLMLACSSAVQAAPISLEYQGFYQRLKQVNKGNYQLVELAFSVTKTAECRVIDGTISTEKESFPLIITKAQRIFLPFDQSLKSDRALVNLNMQGDGSRCAIAMQVRAKNTKGQYQQEEVAQIQTEMDELLSNMQGFPMRYFSSEIAGLNLEFENDATLTIDGVVQPVSGTYRLSRQAIADLSELKMNPAPAVISPWTAP